MNNVSFYGESAGSVAQRINGSSSHGESTGSIAERINEPMPTMSEPIKTDVVSFRGDDKKESGASALGVIGGTLLAAAVIIGGAGYAHKAGWIGKMKDGKVKDFFNKVAEPCHKWCAKAKSYATQGWEKVKGWFGGNKKA